MRFSFQLGLFRVCTSGADVNGFALQCCGLFCRLIAGALALLALGGCGFLGCGSAGHAGTVMKFGGCRAIEADTAVLLCLGGSAVSLKLVVTR